jgi:hypothetical protein
MSGVYVCGEASITTEGLIATGQTPASEEHTGEITGVVFSGAGETHPALTRSAVTMITAAGIARREGVLSWLFSDMIYLIIRIDYLIKEKSTR